MPSDGLQHTCIHTVPSSYSSILNWNCCSLSHHLVPTSTDRASLSPTLDDWILPHWLRDSWVWLKCWPHVESGCSTSWCADPTPPASSSYLVVVLVIGVGDLEASSVWGEFKQRQCKSPLFLYWCTTLLPIQWYLPPPVRKSLFPREFFVLCYLLLEMMSAWSLLNIPYAF
jgi:hypothetical protein